MAARASSNQDTGWGWPPYMKFDSADMQARASNLISDSSNPNWVKVTYYGWRSQIFSIFPNAIDLQPVAGPDVRIIPWLKIVILVILALLILLIRAGVKAFWRNRIDPIVDDVRSAFSDAEDSADRQISQAQKRFRGRKERFREWWVELFG
jgi:hypothetical protein